MSGKGKRKRQLKPQPVSRPFEDSCIHFKGKKIRTGLVILIAILLLGTGLRLHHFTDPYLDHHSWRQTLTAMMARNFYENRNLNIFKPEVDWNGNESSVIELEFQITTFLTAILYHIFGLRDWVGRIIPIIFSILSTIYLYKLVKFHTQEKLALFTAFVYSILPLHVFFTRVPMPESVMLYLSIASLYFFSLYVKNETPRGFALALIFTCLALISKLAALHLVIPLLFIAYSRYKSGLLSNGAIWIYFTSAVAVAGFYYGYMHYSADIHMFSYKVGTDKWGNLEVWRDGGFYKTLFSRFRTLIFTLPGLLLLIAGLFLGRRKLFFYVWLVSVIIYIFAIGKGNQIHSYYQMPVVPVGAYFIASTLHRVFEIKKLRLLPIAICGVLLFFSIKALPPLYDLYALPCYEAAMKVREIDKSNSLILTVPHRSDLEPEILYYAGRKGWIVRPHQLSLELIEEYRNKGAGYMVMTQPTYLRRPFYEVYLEDKTYYQDKNYLIVELD